MADTVAHPSMRKEVWEERFWLEYVRNNRFARYSGSSPNSVFQYNERLTGTRGEVIHCNLVGIPRGTPNDGSTQLVGNEKQQFNYSHATKIRTVRDAIVCNTLERQASAIDILNAARAGLRDMASEYLKNDQISALDDRTAQGRMTEDQWNTANTDRIVYGDTIAAASFGAGLTAATAVPTAATINLAKDLAENTGGAQSATNDRDAPNRIRPIRTAEDEEWYVMFCESNFFRSLQNDATISGANREAWQRYGGEAREGGRGGNPLFRGGDLIYDGVIVRKIPEIGDLPTLATDRARAYLCGAQAVHVAWAQRTRMTIRKEDDYGYQHGVGFEELREVDKIFWEGSAATTLKQWGVVSIFCAKA